MPFKSKAQQRFMFAAEARGDVPKGTAKRWAHETKSIKKLPEKVEKEASLRERFEGARKGTGGALSTAGLLGGAAVGAGLAARDLKRGKLLDAAKKFTGTAGAGWTLGSLGGAAAGAARAKTSAPETSKTAVSKNWVSEQGALGIAKRMRGVKKPEMMALDISSPIYRRIKNIPDDAPPQEKARSMRKALQEVKERWDTDGDVLRRAKTSAAYKLQGRMEFQGMPISIENKKGSVRRWFDPHGNEKGSTKMHWAYGYIRGTEGTDGDHVDVYIGPNADATHAFVVDQMKKPEGAIKKDGQAWKEFDEQKCMLGWDSAEAAKAAYMKQYDDPRFFGSIKAIPMEQFKEKVMDRQNRGKKVAELRLRLAKIKTANLLTQISRYAKNVGKVPNATRQAANAALRSHKPLPLKEFKTQAQQFAERGSKATKSVARKKTPTVGVTPMHKARPDLAIEFAKRTNTPAVGSSSVLDQLSRTSFDKLSEDERFLVEMEILGVDTNKIAHNMLVADFADLGIEMAKLAMTPNKMRELISQGASKRGYSLSPEEHKAIAKKSLKYFKAMKADPGGAEAKKMRSELRGLVKRFKQPSRRATGQARPKGGYSAHRPPPSSRGFDSNLEDEVRLGVAATGVNAGAGAVTLAGKKMRQDTQRAAEKDRRAAYRDRRATEMPKAAAKVPAARKPVREHKPAKADAATALSTAGPALSWGATGAYLAPMMHGARRTTKNTVGGGLAGAGLGGLVGYMSDRRARQRLTKAHETTKQLRAETEKTKQSYLIRTDMLDNPEDPLHTPPTERKKTKKANGDMIAYFQEHPEKLKAKQERDRKAEKRAALEKLASELYEDFEYMTEAEKVAITGDLLRAGGRYLGRGAEALARGGRKLKAMGRLKDVKAKGVMPGVGEVDAAVARGARNARTVRAPAATAAKAPAAAGAGGAAAGGGLLSGKNIAKAGILGTMGLGLYAGKKTVDTASDLASGRHHGDWYVPPVQGRGRVF